VTDSDPLDLLRHRLALSARETPECLDDATLAALAEGALDAATHATVLPHLASCPRCRGAVASVARALADPAVAHEVASLERGRRAYWIALPIAAAAVLLLALGVPRWLEQGPTHRAPPIPGQSAPRLLFPVGAVAAAATLRWASVPGADRYRVVLFDAAGRVVYETQLADTVVALPDSVRLAPGPPYLWKVEARTGWDRWSASELVQFSIAAAGHR
jgi:hypothetical protein